MLKYINFQVITFLKRKSNQYFAIGSIFAILLINSIIAAITDNFITTINIQNNILSFALSSIFTLLIVVHVYLQGKDDGTELLFATKSLSRVKLYLGKILSSLFIILVFLISLLLINWVPAVVSSGDSAERSAYVFSQLFGGMVVQMITLFIFSFIAIISTKMKTIISMLLTTVFFPIFTIIAAPLTGGQPSELSSIDKVSYVYDGQKLIKDIGYIDTYTTNIENEFSNYNENETYSSIAAIDIWNQFNSMMNIFNVGVNKFDNSIIQKWEEKTIETTSDTGLSIPAYTSSNINIGAELIYPILSETELTEIDFDFDQTTKLIDEWFAKFGNELPSETGTKNWLQYFEQANVIQRMKFVQYFIDGVDRTSDIQRESIFNTTFKFGSTRATLVEYLNNIDVKTAFAYEDFLDSNETFDNLVSPTSISNYITNNQSLIGDFLIGGEAIKVYTSTSYINVWASISILLTISFVLVVIGGFIYNWKDFK